jgi:hypothetical protein
VRAMPASKKKSPVRHRDEWQSPIGFEEFESIFTSM